MTQVLNDVRATSLPHGFTVSAFGDEIAADFEQQLQVLQQEGIRYLELRSAWGKNLTVLTDDEISQIEQLLARYSVQVSAIGSPIGKIPVTDPLEPELARLERVIAIAQRLGTPYVRMFSFFLPQHTSLSAEIVHDTYRDEVLSRLQQFVQIAEARNVILLHENEKDVYGDTATYCADLLQAVNSPHLLLTFDPANFVQVGVKPLTEAYPLLKKYIAYLHVKDAFFADGRVVVAGAGEGQVAELMQTLYQDGYRGFASLEPHLSASGQFSGFSGPQLFHQAASALQQLLPPFSNNQN